MKETTVYPFVFETSWGWCGAWVSPEGVVAFQLPVQDMEKAKMLLRKEKMLPAFRRKKPMDDPTVPALFLADENPRLPDEKANRCASILICQTRAYFEGQSSKFDLPLDWTGRTEFQRLIWKTLCEVPCGKKVCYGELAARAGRPGAARAVGHAMATNPIPLIVPCHRVVGANGSMRGFSAAGGIPIKQRLLQFESKTSGRSS